MDENQNLCVVHLSSLPSFGFAPWFARLLRETFAESRMRSVIAQSRLELGFASQQLIPAGERSGLLTRLAATENVTLRVRAKG